MHPKLMFDRKKTLIKTILRLYIFMCRLLINFANNLDPDIFFEKVDFEKESADDKKACKNTQ